MGERIRTAPYVIMEAAILFESGASKLVDKIATVVAPVEERIEQGNPKKQTFKGTGTGKNAEPDG